MRASAVIARSAESAANDGLGLPLLFFPLVLSMSDHSASWQAAKFLVSSCGSKSAVRKCWLINAQSATYPLLNLRMQHVCVQGVVICWETIAGLLFGALLGLVCGRSDKKKSLLWTGEPASRELI